VKILSADLDKIQKACCHQAGHYVVARELGFKTQGMSLLFAKAGQQLEVSAIEFWNTPKLFDAKDHLERQILVLYAGVVAESTDINGMYDVAYSSVASSSGEGIKDYTKIEELVQLLRKVQYPDITDTHEVLKKINEIHIYLNYKTRLIVSNHIKLIHKIGDMLMDKIEAYNTRYELWEEEIIAIDLYETY